ncbi:hypothetical protein BSKO_11935 [Bryopsis sp. KO-2023]|nr:hypothetical protein BSKO_02010 [Bryopsis sp. KO-2023]GMH34995.1 hypothetical protein BSKO_02856 [Bryopsis sp. KO-2023]GMH44001.1 hypothetical protein BSKO_11935 [Bryopsis sp. KO-2023]
MTRLEKTPPGSENIRDEIESDVNMMEADGELMDGKIPGARPVEQPAWKPEEGGRTLAAMAIFVQGLQFQSSPGNCQESSGVGHLRHHPDCPRGQVRHRPDCTRLH